MQGARMQSGRSTPLASYADGYRALESTGWIAAFSTTGYPDGIFH